MEKIELNRLQKDLNCKRLQLNSIYEFSSALQSSSAVSDIMPIFFSILMGFIGISRAFFFDKKNRIFYKKGFFLSPDELIQLKKNLRKTITPFSCVHIDTLPPELKAEGDWFAGKKLYYLVDISEKRRDPVILGLGAKMNGERVSPDDEEFIFFLSRFAQIAINNVFFLKQILEKKRMEYEMSIASQIQHSLLPQGLPRLNHYDIAVIYEPIREVGGDYYDFFQRKNHVQGVVLADVEGKGLSSALLAASSQAIFHTMNELYLFQPAKFVHKANSILSKLIRGNRFITLVWMLLDDVTPSVTYVNAGHCHPYIISDHSLRRMDKGGVFLGMSEEIEYQQETIPLKPGDIILACTDGVLEAVDQDGEEFGEKRLVEIARSRRRRSAEEIAQTLYKRIRTFSQKHRFKDDFTILVIKTIERRAP